MQQDPNKTTVVAGKGYTTAGTHYQALRFKLNKYPNFLKNAKVFIEYTGGKQFSKPFSEEQYRVFESDETSKKIAMPQKMLPYINSKSLLEFEEKSTNSKRVKVEMLFLYFSSLYRSVSFINDYLQKLDYYKFTDSKILLDSDGLMANEKLLFARKKAIISIKRQMEESKNNPILKIESLDKSILAHINIFIKENGGKLFLYKMPLHSSQQKVFSSDKEKLNQKIFERWLKTNGIQIIYNNNFDFNDSDFPDTWHLRKDRRDEFSLKLYNEIKSKLD